jgi:hypothetical protein
LPVGIIAFNLAAKQMGAKILKEKKWPRTREPKYDKPNG